MSVVNVPFTTTEWKVVKSCFLKSGEDLKPATDILTLWRLRQGHETYLIFQITDHLLTLDRLDSQTDIRDDLQLKTLLNNYAAVVVRVINYIHDICQCNSQAPTMAQSVASMGIPKWIVDIRHCASHKMMPKLCVFRKAARFLRREWLYNRYWDKSVQAAMKWAVPKAALEGENNRKRLEEKQLDGFNLLVNYVKWRNEKPTMLPNNLNYDCLNAIVAFMQKEPDVIISLLTKEMLILTKEKAQMHGFEIDPENTNIWEIPAEYQLYWSPLISTIYHNHMFLALIKITLETMFLESTEEYDRVQLAGWIDLYIMMVIKGKHKAFGEGRISEWKPIIKIMLNQISYFKDETFVEVLEKAKIFEPKKIEQITKLIKLRARDVISDKLASSSADNAGAKHLIKTTNNFKNLSDQIGNYQGIVDVNDGNKFALADVDFTGVPLGLMPDQSCETLYLILD